MATLELVPSAVQAGFAFPQLLTERYQPQTVEEFAGLDQVRNAMRNLIRKPYPCAHLFIGPSGTGKTSMGLAVARQMPAELHHIQAQDCDLATIGRLYYQCHMVPRIEDEQGQWRAAPMHLILIDELDRASYPAQMALLSKLDHTTHFPNTVVIATTNDKSNLEGRLLSRFMEWPFSSYGLAKPLASLLSRVWDSEVSDPSAERPNFDRLVKEANNNARAALMSLQKLIMCA